MKSQNRMKPRAFWTLALTFFVTCVYSLTSLADGGSNGGGGKGVRCPGRPLETLDLYQARREGFPVPRSLGSIKAEVERYFPQWLAHLNGGSPMSTSEKKDFIEFKKKFISFVEDPFGKPPFGISDGSYRLIARSDIPSTDDVTLSPDLIEPGCELIQIGNTYSILGSSAEEYGPNEKVVFHLDPDLYAELDSHQKVAYWAHELTYSRLNLMQVSAEPTFERKTSDEVRKVIGAIFSGQQLDPIIPILNSPHFWCGFSGYSQIEKKRSSYTEIYGQVVNRYGIKGVELYFQGIKGFMTTSRTSAFLPGVSVDHFINPNSFFNHPNIATIYKDGSEIHQNFTVAYPTQRISVQPYLASPIDIPILKKKWHLEFGMRLFETSNRYELVMRVTVPGHAAPEWAQGTCDIED